MNNKIAVQYFRRPAYYKDFHCIGSECPVNCCFGWDNIGWKKKEYGKLKNADMSEELRSKIEMAFEKMKNEELKKFFDYKIKYVNNKCPMVDENGLCMIQKELGEEYLSSTCRTYPRKKYISGNAAVCACNSSCVHVLKTICNNENSMQLENSSHIENNNSFELPYNEVDKLRHPTLKYDRELFEFFYELLSDKTHSIETSFVLAGMAAQKIDEFVKKGQADRVPEIIRALKPQLNSPAQIEKIENAKENLSLKRNFAAGLLNLLKDMDIYRNVFENGIPSAEKWNEGQSTWNETFGDRPYVMRNIALNFFLSQRMPFRDKDLTLFENISYLAAQMSVTKFLAAAVPVQFGKNAEELFYISVAYIDRSFTHNDVQVHKIIDYMKAFGVTSPAFLLGILK